MNLALTYLWKEWRAQRALLLAYSGMVFACLCLGLYLAPRHYWGEEAFGVHALSWFVLAGVLGVVAFVVPGLVRGEFVGGRGDQFVRRLPGALWPAFWGKLLFFGFSALALPLSGLLVGELFLTALGGDWSGLFRWQWDGQVQFAGRMAATPAAAGLLCAPWVWAIGTWMPGGRLALLGTVLFGLVLGIGAVAVERHCPKLYSDFPWMSWLWTVPVSGTVAAAFSWGRGRRFGGPLSSARVGLGATALLLMPWCAWLGERAWRYRVPRPERLESFYVSGVTPDGRYALVRGSERESWAKSTFRVDLDSGAARQLCGVGGYVTSEVTEPAMMSMGGEQRLWRGYSPELGHFVYDLQQDESASVEWDVERNKPTLPGAFADRLAVERREQAFLRAPGYPRIWFELDALVFEDEQGLRERMPLPWPSARSVRACGHGVQVWLADGRSAAFDLVRREGFERHRKSGIYVVGPLRLVSGAPARPAEWFLHDANNTEPVAVDALRGCSVLGLLDDERLLVARPVSAADNRPARLSVYDLACDEQSEIAFPPGCRVKNVGRPFGWCGSLLARDGGNGIWLRVRRTGRQVDEVLRLDVDNLSLESIAVPFRDLLRFEDYPRVLLGTGEGILRVDLATGARKWLFGTATGAAGTSR